jgi:hypothetical protein
MMRFLHNALVLVLLSCGTICAAQERFGGFQKFAAASGGGGSATIVQVGTNYNVGQSSIAVTLPSVGNGNMVIVQVGVAEGTSYTPASANCSDGVASYTLNNSQVNFNGFWVNTSMGTWSRVTSASASLTITVTFTGIVGAQAAAMVAYEVSGLASKVYDSGNTGGTASSSPSTSPLTGTFNTTAAGIIVALQIDNVATGTITHTAGSGYAISKSGNAHLDNDSSFMGYMGINQITSGSLTGTTAGGTVTSEGWSIIASAFK